MVSKNGAYAATSVEAWNEHTTETIELTEHLSVEIQSVDFLALLTAGEGMNPLLALLQNTIDHDEKGLPEIEEKSLDMNELLKDPTKLKNMVEGLDSILKQIVVSPRLKEQGFEDGISLARFKTEWKMRIFEHISGGSVQLETAQRFLPTEGSSLVVASPS